MSSPRVEPVNPVTQTFGGVTRDWQEGELDLWEADTDTDLVAANAGEILDCYDDAASFDDFVLLFGATTDATRWRLIRPAAGEGHDGTPNNGVFFDWTASGANASFAIDESFSQIHDLVCRHIVSSVSEEEVFILREPGNRTIGCIAFESVNSGTGTVLGYKIQEDDCLGVLCLAISGDTHGFQISGSAGFDQRWYNCVAINNTGRGFNSAGSGDRMAKNCLASGNTIEDFDDAAGSWVTGSVNNASSDTTADEGGLDIPTAVVDATFIFVDVSSDDYHLDTGDTDALDAGADLSADSFFPFDEDIDGEVFDTWDIGFDEPEPAAGDIIVTGGTAALTIAGQSAVIIAGASVVVTGGTAALTIAGQSAVEFRGTQVGFKITSIGGTTNYQHTPQKHAIYGPNDTWWCIAQDNTSADWALWEWDGTFPATPGDAGGWDYAQLVSGGGDLYVESRGQAHLNIFWEPGSEELHVWAPFLTTGEERYNLYSYNSGTNDWTHDVTDETTGVPDVEDEGARSSMAVDSNGKVWVVYVDRVGETLVAGVRANGIGGAWTASAEVLEATATDRLDSSRCSIVAWDNAGTPSIGVFYSWGIAAGDKWRFAYRADSDADGAAWTFEDVDTTTTIDDHADIAAANLGTDTTSTLVACGKNGEDNMVAWRRTPAGSWQTAVIVNPVGTRPHVLIDSTNSEVYFSYHPKLDNAIAHVYRKSVADGTLSFSGEQIIMRVVDGEADFRKSHGVPAGGELNSDTGLLYLGEGGSVPWWNIVPLAGGVFTGGTAALSIAGQTAGVVLGHKAAPATAALAIAGQPATMVRGHRALAGAATLSIEGQPAVGVRGHIAAPATAALVIAGEAATMRAGVTASPATAPLVIAGQAATVRAGLKASPSTAALNISGQLAAVRAGLKAFPATAELAIEGQAATVRAGSIFSPATAPLIITGQPAVIILGGAVVLTGLTAALTIGGQPGNMVFGKVFTPATAPLNISGQLATIRAGLNAFPATAELVISGQSATVRAGAVFAPAEAPLIISGQAATLIHGQVLSAASAELVISGQTADIIFGASIIVTGLTAALTIGGQAAALVHGHSFAPSTAGLVIGGQPATAVHGQILTPGTAALTLTGEAANFVGGYRALPDTATLTIGGQSANLVRGHLFSAAQAQLVITGQLGIILITEIIPPDDRLIIVAQEDRFFVISGELRFFTVSPDR